MTHNVTNLIARRIKGFTLVELLAVISIMAILATITAIGVAQAQKRNRDARRKADLAVIGQALQLYTAENRQYPAVTTNSLNTTSPWINGLTTRYVPNGLPVDPKNNAQYFYSYTSDGKTYTIKAKLENTRDKDANIIGGFYTLTE